MRRLLAITVLAAAVGAVSLLGTGAGGETGSSYLVEAEFRNAFSIIPGEDVKIAGVKVGKIKDLDVTDRQTAAVLLEITEPGFGDWRADAECSIRPQSLIGEKFVECTPTQPRPQGAAAAAPLKTKELDGDTVAVLGVDRTRRAVDIDLVNNVLRLPYRERLTIILNEFGAGVAGRGEDLAKIIRTADPALKATDDVLDLLAEQDDVLRKLAVDSDAALAPITRDRERVTSFVTQAGKVATATAERREDLEKNLQRLPTFLRELRPTMQRLGALSDEGTPLLRDLNTVGPGLSRFIRQLGPFSRAATPAFTTLGDATVVGRDALVKSRPIIKDLKTFAGSSKVLARNLRDLTESFRDTGGIERLMDYVFYQVAAVNGFDQYGHYLRAQLLVNLCSVYSIENDAACTANFVKVGESRSARAAGSDADRDPALVRTEAVLRGADPADVLGEEEAAKAKKKADADERKARSASPAIKLPAQVLPGAASAAPAPSAPAKGSPGAAPASSPAASGTEGLLDYLMGGGS